MRVVLLRHAQTAESLPGQYIGSSDAPLCEAGRRLAESRPPCPAVRRVYTSRLQRSAETARILYPNAEIIRCAGLNEMDFGRFEQKSWRDLEEDADYRAWVDSGCEAPCPGGEDKAAFTRRCVKAFWPIARKEAAAGAAELHCVLHGGSIMAILSELAEPRRDYFSWTAGFCGGYVLEYAEAGGRPLRLLDEITPDSPL